MTKIRDYFFIIEGLTFQYLCPTIELIIIIALILSVIITGIIEFKILMILQEKGYDITFSSFRPKLYNAYLDMIIKEKPGTSRMPYQLKGDMISHQSINIKA